MKTSDNIRLLVNILSVQFENLKDGVLIPLDATKSFDMVQTTYLEYSMLQKEIPLMFIYVLKIYYFSTSMFYFK